MEQGIRIAENSETVVEARVTMGENGPVLELVKVHPPRPLDHSGGDDTKTGIAGLFLDLFGMGEIAEALEIFLRASDDTKYPARREGYTAAWDELPAGEYLLLADLKEGGGSASEGLPLTLTAGTHGGGATVRMDSGVPKVVDGEIAAAPGPPAAPPAPGAAPKSAPVAPLVIYPTMVVDYEMGALTQLARESDPRFLLDPEALADKNELIIERTGRPVGSTRWSLGRGGWIILGFDNGFISDRDYNIRFRETGNITEWVHVWVAQTIDAENPVIYDPSTGPYAYLNNVRLANETDPDQLKQATNPEQRPAWVTANWKYVGAVRGSGGTATGGNLVDGPHLGNVPFGRYKYMLMHDTGNAPNPPTNAWYGADIMETGVFARSELVNNTTYHLLIVDLSVSAGDVPEKYRDAVKIFLQALHAKPGKHKLGLRTFNGKASDPDGGTRRVKLKAGEGADGVFWLDIENGTPDFDTLWAEVSGHMVFSGATPLLNALKAATELDLRSTTDPAVDPDKWPEPIPDAVPPGTFVEIVLLTDGLPDPDSDYPGDTSAYSATQKEDTITRINTPVMEALEALAAKAKGYQAEMLGAFDADSSEFRKQVFEAYKSREGDLSDARNRGFLARVTDLKKKENDKDAVVLDDDPIDHTAIPHTDCLNGNRADARRIGKGEAKRETRAFSNGRTAAPGPRLRTPLIWSTRLENVEGMTPHTPRYPGTGAVRRVAEHRLPDSQLEP